MSQARRQNVKRATIRDVAQAAGVSVTTVSNALNGRTEAMTEATLLRIQETIHSLNYRPSTVARSLVTQQTATIGVIVTEIETPLFLQALNVIEPMARNADYSILLCTTAYNLDDESQAVNLLLEKQVEGIIILSTSLDRDNDDLARLPSSAPPIVLINRARAYDGRFDQINVDNLNGIIKGIEYLFGLGHRRIAHLCGPPARRSSQERLRGYQLGLKRHGLAYCDEYVRPGNYEEAQTAWEQSTLELLALSPRPTAIIAANDIVAATALRTAQRAGLRVPQEISIIGVDNQPFCTYLNPALSTIQLPLIEAGKLAMEMLLDRLAGRRTATEQITLSCPLIERESSGAAE